MPIAATDVEEWIAMRNEREGPEAESGLSDKEIIKLEEKTYRERGHCFEIKSILKARIWFMGFILTAKGIEALYRNRRVVLYREEAIKKIHYHQD